MQSLDAPITSVLSEYYTTLYEDVFTALPPSIPALDPPGWSFMAITLPYAVFGWVVLQKLCLYSGTTLGLIAGFPRNRSHNMGDAFREVVGMTITTGIAYKLLASEPWVWDLSQWSYAIVEGPNFVSDDLPPDVGIRKSYAAYYPIECGWYAGLLVCLLMETPRKSDFYVMLSHHVVTIFLVAHSATVGHMRVGVLVMILHDSSDTLLNGSKVLHYALEGSRWHWICDVVFAVFTAVFFVTRLVLLPYLISQLYDVGWVRFGIGEKSMLVALVLLVLFHVYWFSLIMKILMEAVKGGQVQGDVRDDDEVDSQRKRGGKSTSSASAMPPATPTAKED